MSIVSNIYSLSKLALGFSFISMYYKNLMPCINVYLPSNSCKILFLTLGKIVNIWSLYLWYYLFIPLVYLKNIESIAISFGHMARLMKSNLDCIASRCSRYCVYILHIDPIVYRRPIKEMLHKDVLRKKTNIFLLIFSYYNGANMHAIAFPEFAIKVLFLSSIEPLILARCFLKIPFTLLT